MKSAIVAASLVLAGPAVADSFDSLSMGRLTPVSTVSFELGFESWDEPALTDIDVYTLNIAGHFVNRSGAGAYFVLPLTYLDLRLGGFDDSDVAIGNAEVGGLFTRAIGRTAFIFHGGVGLPTAQDEGASAFQVFGAFTRMSDLALHITNSTWARLGVSPMGQIGRFIWRADVGLDIALDEDNPVEYSPIFHLNVGGGVDLGTAQLLVELVNVYADPEDTSDDSASTLTLGARFTTGDLRPGIGLLLPLDVDSAADFELALLGSLAVRIP